jgi:hypothetical protein
VILRSPVGAGRRHISKTSGNLMLACTYYGGLSDQADHRVLDECLNEGYAGQMAMQKLVNDGREMWR